MIAALASLRLTLISVGALVIWLWLGAAMSNSQTWAEVFRSLNQEPLLAWLRGAADKPWAAAWVIGFLALSGLLIVNLAVCSVMRLIPGGNAGKWRRWLVLVLHLLMLAVMLAHGASFFLGAKHSGLRLLPGQSAELPGGLRLYLDRVSYTADPGLLALNRKQARLRMNRATFSRHDNSAEVTIFRGSQRVAHGRILYFHPLRVEGMGVHLTGFYAPKKGSDKQIGITCNAVQSPLWPLFSAAYAAVLAALLWFTWLESKAVRSAEARRGQGGNLA